MKINSRETHRKSLVHVFSDRISCIIKPLNNVSPVSSIQCNIYKKRRNHNSCFHFFKCTLTSHVILLWKERAEKFHFLVSLLNLVNGDLWQSLAAQAICKEARHKQIVESRPTLSLLIIISMSSRKQDFTSRSV